MASRVPYVLSALGAILLAVAVTQIVSLGWTLSRGERAQGKVRKLFGTGTAMTTDASIDFEDHDGRTVRILRLVDGELSPGDGVALAFLRSAPRDAKVIGPWSLALVPGLLTLFGLPIFFVGTMLRRAQTNRPDAAQPSAPRTDSDLGPKAQLPLAGKLLAGFLVLFSGLWFWMGLSGLSKYAKIQASGHSLPGTIEKIETSYSTSRDSKGRSSTSVSYDATIRYDDPKDGAKSFVQTLIGDQRMYEEGERVKLDYVAGAPPIVAMEGTHELWRELLPIVAGFFFLLPAWVVARVMRRLS